MINKSFYHLGRTICQQSSPYADAGTDLPLPPSARYFGLAMRILLFASVELFICFFLPVVSLYSSACSGSARHRQGIKANNFQLLFSCFFLWKELTARQDGSLKTCLDVMECHLSDKYIDSNLYKSPSYHHDKFYHQCYMLDL